MRRTVTSVVRSETGQQVCNAARPKLNRFPRRPRAARRKTFPGTPPADASLAPAWFSNPPARSAPTFPNAGLRPAGCESAPANPGLLPAFAAEARTFPAQSGLASAETRAIPAVAGVSPEKSKPVPAKSGPARITADSLCLSRLHALHPPIFPSASRSGVSLRARRVGDETVARSFVAGLPKDGWPLRLDLVGGRR